MTVHIQAIHFEIAERLTDFINKKADRLVRRYPDLDTFNVTLKVVKPETAMNKEATIRVTMPGAYEMIGNKIADTFEEAVDTAIEAIERQLEKKKTQKGRTLNEEG